MKTVEPTAPSAILLPDAPPQSVSSTGVREGEGEDERISSSDVGAGAKEAEARDAIIVKTPPALEQTEPPSHSTAPRPLLDFIRETGFSKHRLAQEAQIGYSQLNNLVAGHTAKPKPEVAGAILTTLNHYRVRMNLPVIEMQAVQEFTSTYQLLVMAKTLAEAKAATTTNDNSGKNTNSTKYQRPPRHVKQDRPGRPKGSGVKRPAGGQLPTLSAIERFMVEVFGPQSSYGRKARAAQLLNELASLMLNSAQAKGEGEFDGPVSSVHNFVDLEHSVEQETTPLSSSGFNLRATQEALSDPTLQTRLGKLQFQFLLPKLPSATATTPTSSNATPQVPASKVKVKMNLFTQTLSETADKGNELTLSLSEFEMLTLLQLYFLKELRELSDRTTQQE